MSHLIMYLAAGVAETAAKYRPGAKHAMLIYVYTDNLDAAAEDAVEAAERNGWVHLELRRAKELDPDPSEIADDILRDAAQCAVSEGSAIVVYADEIPHDA
ncbi:hypothetical protein [Novosphingobium mangrovi (ex Huang et al. 2023)]|uniref:Uncharacterized protein n=1 Tax=Novosphingobium mangrovi (ex Huang et al. 2023) TaxID=2976432 RepID=A0ABT2I223_9SPHN|nr:hypothetical protein [Novosphingobium mangrovi (ex Huang et al. 2023)]MCT2398858.1 hypothetical protein [Novosphingobium mangrovi (ex Huang et al. 2023)]